MEYISSLNNEKVKYISKLVKSAKERRVSGEFVAEGLRMVREIPEEDVLKIYFTQECFDRYAEKDERLRKLIKKADEKGGAFTVTDQILKKMSDTETPQGILATVKIKEKKLEDIYHTDPGESDGSPFLLILERLQDPGNMGTIVRSAEGAGCSGIVVSSDSVDIYSPKVVRSTMGSIFRSCIYISHDLKKDIDLLKEKGISIYAMHLRGQSMYEADFTGPSAFLIGNEGAGLSDEISRKADKLILIPMKGEVESLNAAVSASLICYETLRQRMK